MIEVGLNVFPLAVWWPILFYLAASWALSKSPRYLTVHENTFYSTDLFKISEVP